MPLNAMDGGGNSSSPPAEKMQLLSDGTAHMKIALKSARRDSISTSKPATSTPHRSRERCMRCDLSSKFVTLYNSEGRILCGRVCQVIDLDFEEIVEFDL